MAVRFALLFQDGPTGLCLDRLCSLLEPLGLRLEHPDKRQPIVLDEIGDQWPIEHDDLRARVALGEDTTFELWYGVDHDLICRSRLTDSVRVTAFALDGTDEAERVALVQILERAACDDGVEGGWLGLVWDPEGITAGYDWDDFFLREAQLSADDFPEGMPNMLLVAENLVSRLEGFHTQSWGGGMVRVVDE